MTTLQARTWEGRLDANSTLFPHLDVFVEALFAEPESAWFDAPATVEKETRASRVNAAFAETWLAVSSKHGPYGESWAWGKVRGTDVNHMASLPGFGVRGLETSGTRHTINATQKTHGPSWRMVATFDTNGPRAWGVYPGGPSGNPASPSYAPMVEPWMASRAEVLLFPADVAAARALAGAPRQHSVDVLVPEGVSLWKPAWSDTLAKKRWWLIPALSGLVGLVVPGGLFLAAGASATVASLGWGLPLVSGLAGAHHALIARMGSLLGVSSSTLATGFSFVSLVPFLATFLLAALPAALLGLSSGALRLWMTGGNPTPLGVASRTCFRFVRQLFTSRESRTTATLPLEPSLETNPAHEDSAKGQLS
jgi:hypothetical protein